MKRKFKLFATVASLCLSVALMAFGVYAASTVTYNVSGSVSFTDVQVATSWTAAVYKEAAKTNKWAGTDGAYSIDEAGSTSGTPNWNPDITFTTTDKVAVFVIECTNNGKAPIAIEVSGAGIAAIPDQLTVSMQDGVDDSLGAAATVGDLGETNLAPGSTYTVEITVTLTLLSDTLEETPLTLTLTAKPAV